MQDERDDQQLILAVGRGDKAAFAAFVRRHAGGLLRFARRYLYAQTGGQADAEDVVQEAVLRVWKSAPLWTPQGASPRSWVYRITYNLCIDQLRRTRPAPEPDTEENTPTPSLEHDALRNESVAQVDQALQSLPERQRAALTLCALEGLSNKDAAAALDISVQALESLLARARRSLRQQLLEIEANDRVTSKID